MEIVITGIGLVSPIGIGRETFWNALCRGQSGVGHLKSFDTAGLPVTLAAEVHDFDPKKYIAQRKQIKVMCRDAQLGVAAAGLAQRDARIEADASNRDRFGVILGADRICMSLPDSEPPYRASIVDGRFVYPRFGAEGMTATYPLNFLKVLPNMIASHVTIALDARGPCNTIHHAEASGLLAVAEAANVIRRGSADRMLAGGASSQLNPFDCVRHCVMGDISRRLDAPHAAMRPFDADRDGQVWGEGSAAMILETRQHAEARGATIYGRLLASASACDSTRPLGEGPGVRAAGSKTTSGDGLRRAMRLALEHAQLTPHQLGFISANGLSTAEDDILEAEAIRDVAPDVPVIAPKSYFGNLGAASGAMELAAAFLALHAGQVPPTLNYERPDSRCPIRVVHGRPMPISHRSALLVSRTAAGQSVAVIVGGE